MKNKIVERYRKKYPERQRARCLIQSRIQRGTLKRGPCSTCGKEKSDAHHPDYTRPDYIIWLCRQCHGEVHRNKCCKCDMKHHAKSLCRTHYRLAFKEKWYGR